MDFSGKSLQCLIKTALFCNTGLEGHNIIIFLCKICTINVKKNVLKEGKFYLLKSYLQGPSIINYTWNICWLTLSRQQTNLTVHSLLWTNSIVYLCFCNPREMFLRESSFYYDNMYLINHFDTIQDLFIAVFIETLNSYFTAIFKIRNSLKTMTKKGFSF